MAQHQKLQHQSGGGTWPMEEQVYLGGVGPSGNFCIVRMPERGLIAAMELIYLSIHLSFSQQWRKGPCLVTGVEKSLWIGMGSCAT